jgi:hypothetical protein
MRTFLFGLSKLRKEDGSNRQDAKIAKGRRKLQVGFNYELALVTSNSLGDLGVLAVQSLFTGRVRSPKSMEVRWFLEWRGW